MISYAKGNLITNVNRGTILHQTNCLGVMGAGFALQLRRRYPENYATYHAHCIANGRSLLGTCLTTASNDLTIINAFGQLVVGGRKATSYDALDTIFYNMYHKYGSASEHLKHIHMPMIGAGLGGGSWDVIEQIILSHLPEDNDITVWKLW